MPLPTTAEPRRRALLRDEVFGRLRDAIVDGTLSPGEQLRDADVATWLGVSRTPVREAVLRLGEAGLVHAEPGRSTTVAHLDPAAVADARAVVAAMHRLAVAEAVERLSVADLETMRTAHERFEAAVATGDVVAALDADDAFHAVPVVVAGNRAVAAVLDQYTPVVRRLERARFGSSEAHSSVDLHVRLLDLCEAGDAEGAAGVAFRTWQSLGS
ncbi:GntR family transcriptional regulator [Oryzobacter terrae]|uniref:GntR family transcriptional regulator n=1 Tax=Oryzobacter terrae TaxID=1620385 RepID=UPI003670F67A